MAVAVALNGTIPNPVDASENSISIFGTLTLSGNYGAGGAHGDILDLSALGLPSGSVPNAVFIYEEPTAGNAPIGYSFVYAKGTTLANGKLVVMQGAASGNNPSGEITQGGAYPGALTAGTANVKFNAILFRL